MSVINLPQAKISSEAFVILCGKIVAENLNSGSATISYDSSKKTDTPVVVASVSISKVNIHIGDDWTIGILNAGGILLRRMFLKQHPTPQSMHQQRLASNS